MPDFSSVPIPPQNIGGIEPSKNKPDSAQKPAQPGQDSFKETLMKQLDQIKADTDQMANATPPSYEEMDQAMNAAKNAFSDTMQAHNLMQQLFKPDSSNENSSEEGK
jgi:hypothetical protein